MILSQSHHWDGTHKGEGYPIGPELGTTAMSFTDSIKTCFQKYIDFNGRASRSEFWWFFLFTLLVRIVTTWIPGLGFIITLALLLPSLSVTARRLHDTNRTGWWMLLYVIPVLSLIAISIVIIVLVVISFSDTWEDTDVAWGIFIFLLIFLIIISLVSAIVLLIFLVTAGTVGPNRFGADPLQPQQDTGGLDYPHPDHTYAPPATSGYGTAGQLPPQTHSSANPISDSGEHRYCTQCGMQMQPEAQFCTFCGTAV